MSAALKSKRDYDMDRIGTTDPKLKAAGETDSQAKQERAANREDLRLMDSEMSSTPGYSTAHVDSQRHMPASKAGDLNPRKATGLPEKGSVREPVSSWQRRQRYTASLASQEATPMTEQETAADMLSGSQTWLRVNDQLSKHTGNAHELDPADEKIARRMDRTIQRFERRNDRSHVVYSNVVIPANVSTPAVYANTLAEGEIVDFDRYTAAAHNLHETEDYWAGDRMVTLEIATRRGRYYGEGARGEQTGHLLPRGLRLAVIGNERVAYTRPDGSTGHRHVIQLADVSDT